MRYASIRDGKFVLRFSTSFKWLFFGYGIPLAAVEIDRKR